MRAWKAVLCGLILVTAVLVQLGATQQPAATAAIFAVARLILGDGRAPIENASFIVENDHFTTV